MMTQPPQPGQRVSPMRFPERYELPGRPDAPAAGDAYRQTQFLLGNDLELFATGMDLQLQVLRDSSPSRYRTHPLAAVVGLWSRAYLGLADACTLLTRGSYVSCLPLVRAACECVAAQEGLRRADMDEFLGWLAATLKPNERHKATEVELGRYFAGEVLAGDERLRDVYRPASDLGRPNFGATLLQVGPESNNQRLALVFADGAFHIGWAELVLGWLLALAERQIHVTVDADDLFPISDDVRSRYDGFARGVDAALANSARCSIEEVEEEGYKRYLVHNFRRTSGTAPKKVLL